MNVGCDLRRRLGFPLPISQCHIFLAFKVYKFCDESVRRWAVFMPLGCLLRFDFIAGCLITNGLRAERQLSLCLGTQRLHNISRLETFWARHLQFYPHYAIPLNGHFTIFIIQTNSSAIKRTTTAQKSEKFRKRVKNLTAYVSCPIDSFEWRRWPCRRDENA